MAKFPRKRTGEFLRIIFGQLRDKPEGMQAKDILAHIPQQTEMSEYEMGFYPSTPNSPRYVKITRFATIDCVKAGWLVKEKGRWYITEEGRSAYQNYQLQTGECDLLL